ncbi:hypothetical protein [Fibrobacter sp.]|uniref:hypothetical protein n=1 Tax=Fibrobacter sp. TaxID=35828 RepID=UPI00386D92AD
MFSPFCRDPSTTNLRFFAQDDKALPGGQEQSVYAVPGTESGKTCNVKTSLDPSGVRPQDDEAEAG